MSNNYFEIKKGDTRIVIIPKSPQLKFVIKLSIIVWSWSLFFKFINYRFGQIKKWFKRIKKSYDDQERFNAIGVRYIPYKRYEACGCLENSLFLGLMSNWHEWRFYYKTKCPLLAPTYFSFFGLINFQKKVEPILLSDEALRLYALRHCKNKSQAFMIAHVFSNSSNFGLTDGLLQLVDYGNIRHQLVLEVNWEALFNAQRELLDNIKVNGNE